jgi:hypothetical protein
MFRQNVVRTNERTKVPINKRQEVGKRKTAFYYYTIITLSIIFNHPSNRKYAFF